MKHILLLLLMIIFTLPAHAQETNYCHDKDLFYLISSTNCSILFAKVKHIAQHILPLHATIDYYRNVASC